MMDGTEDGNGVELEAVVLRYWDGDDVAENVIAMKPAFDRSAAGLMEKRWKNLGLASMV